MSLDCLIVGSGPAALIAADFLSARGASVAIFEKRGGPGWKLLVAGSSGLNVGFDCPPEQLAGFYFSRQTELAACFKKFGRDEWLEHLRGLGEEPYLGTSKRYFVKNWKASALLSAWTERLEKRGVKFHYGEDFCGLRAHADQRECKADSSVEIEFRSGRKETAKNILLALGGASWENEIPAWAQALRGLGLDVADFRPSNTGYHIAAPAEFFAEAQGKPIKGLILRTARGTKQGEMMVTKYGFEGTPVYTIGCSGLAHMDLKPELPEDRLLERLRASSGTMRERIVRVGKLSEGAACLVKYLADEKSLATPESAAALLKNFPVTLTEPRPLAESISSQGGLSWDELGADMQAKKIPGVFCAGEMLDWDAPTGGFLLTACASTGYAAAEGIKARL